MDNQDFTQNSPSDKLLLNRAKSYNTGSTNLLKVKNEMSKRNSFNDSNAVRLDQALGRLKKSKLVAGEYIPSHMGISGSHMGISGSPMSAPSDLFLDASRPRSPTSIYSGVNNSSVVSMNFSHYELIRNLSNISSQGSNSNTIFSTTTSTTFQSPSDAMVRNERLEKYFRSAELWTRKSSDRIFLDMPDK